MFVLVIDRSLYDKKGRETLQAALDGADRQAVEDLLISPSSVDDLSSGPWLRTYGPFATYDEGKCAAMLLGYEADYWVVPLESLTVQERG